MESAIQLMEAKQSDVTIVEMLPEPAATAGKGMLGIPARERNKKAGTTVLYEHAVTEIKDGSVLVKDLNTGEITEIEADTVLLAAGIKPRKDVVAELRHTIAEGDIYIVGDLLKTGGTIGNATTTAFEVAAHI
jgi:NADH dehydrogenase FAD-containing subunit